MLTKTDLSQIRKIVREEVETESGSLQEELQGEIKLSRIEIQKDVHTVKDRIKNLEIAIRKIQKNIKSIVSFFDKEYLNMRQRIEHVEEHVNLPPIH